MRSSTLLSAAFAGCALASPIVKRDPVLEIDTVYDVVYVTQWVTETAGAAPAAEVTSTVVQSSPASSPVVEAPATTTASIAQNGFFKNRYSWSWAWTSTAAASTQAVSEVASSAAPVETSTSAPVIESTSAAYVTPTAVVNVVSSSTSVAVSSYAAASTSSAAETSTAATAQATTYQQRVLVHHNVHRANHSATDLVWDQALANTAQKIGESCVYAHDTTTDGGGYGQNIAAGVQAANISAVITDLFYNGEVGYYENLYGQSSPDMTNFHAWGHFSQIVWKGTTKVGCATVDCSSSGLANAGSNVPAYFTVCNYGPPGNYAGEYADNIGNSLNRATVGWDYGL